MSLLNDVYKVGKINKAELKTLLILLNPFAPHMTEEMWVLNGFDGMLNQAAWPTYDEAKTIDSEIEIVVQINGKTRDKMNISLDMPKDEIEKAAMELEAVKSNVEGKTVVKVINVPGKLVNIVVK